MTLSIDFQFIHLSESITSFFFIAPQAGDFRFPDREAIKQSFTL